MRAWLLVPLAVLGGAVAAFIVWVMLSGLGTAEPALMREACAQTLERFYRHVEKQPDDAELRAVLLAWQAEQGRKLCPECFGGELPYEANPWLRTVRDVRAASKSAPPKVMVYETRLRHSDLTSTPAQRRHLALFLDANGNSRVWEGTADAYWKVVIALNTHSDKDLVSEFTALAENR